MPATATSATGASVRRSTVLAIDVSDSMGRGGKLSAAKAAAQAFLAGAPKDLYVGIVTFAGSVKVAQAPSLDRTASRAIINGLSLSRGTMLYDGIRQAVTVSGTKGQRSMLVLSDGRDTSATPITSVTSDVHRSGVKADVVALAQSPADKARLQTIATAGHGQVLNANDPKALTALFANEAQTLAQQILVTVPASANLGGQEGTLAVTVDAGGHSYQSSAYVSVTDTRTAKTPPTTTPLPAVTSGPAVSHGMMLGGLAALAVALTLIIAIGVGASRPRRTP